MSHTVLLEMKRVEAAIKAWIRPRIFSSSPSLHRNLSTSPQLYNKSHTFYLDNSSQSTCSIIKSQLPLSSHSLARLSVRLLNRLSPSCSKAMTRTSWCMVLLPAAVSLHFPVFVPDFTHHQLLLQGPLPTPISITLKQNLLAHMVNFQDSC